VQDWKSIDEAPASEPIVLRGIPVTVPRAYDRPRRTHPLSIASVAAALWRVSSWSASLLGHLILGIVLVGLIASKPAQKELPAQFHLWKGNQGEHGKSLAEARSDIPEEPQPVTKADPEPERVREAPLTPSVEQPIPLRSPEEPEPLKPAAETAKKEEEKDKEE